MYVANPNDQEVTGHGGAELTVQKLQSYAGTADGNEEVLNAFLHLLNTGEYAERRRTHIFNSYFYTKLKDQG
jgi:Ulp1 family protease